jgi:hypothetical protein
VIYTRLYIIILIFSILLIGFSRAKIKGYLTIAAIIVLSIITSLPAAGALRGIPSSFLYQGSMVTGTIPINIDSLSGWFI